MVEQPERTPEPRDPPPHRRRRHFPDRLSAFRLIGAVLAEQHDEWTEGPRYLGLDILTKSRFTMVSNDTQKEDLAVPALTA